MAALSAALVAGCGGGDDGDSPDRGDAQAQPASAVAAAATPESRFIVRAEAICRKANEREAALGAPGIDWIHSEYFTDLDFLVDFRAVGRSALRDLRRLTPPDDDRARYAEALRAIGKMLRGLDQQVAAVRAGRDSNASSATYERGYIQLAAVGGPLGFTECLGIVL